MAWRLVGRRLKWLRNREGKSKAVYRDNWGGGYLVIGIENKDGKPTNLKGVPAEKIDSYLKDLLNKCKQSQQTYWRISERAAFDRRTKYRIW